MVDVRRHNIKFIYGRDTNNGAKSSARWQHQSRILGRTNFVCAEAERIIFHPGLELPSNGLVPENSATFGSALARKKREGAMKSHAQGFLK